MQALEEIAIDDGLGSGSKAQVTSAMYSAASQKLSVCPPLIALPMICTCDELLQHPSHIILRSNMHVWLCEPMPYQSISAGLRSEAHHAMETSSALHAAHDLPGIPWHAADWWLLHVCRHLKRRR